LLLPLDVGNSRGDGLGLDMGLIWQIVYIIILVAITILLPFAMFIYESDEEKSFNSRL